MPSTFQALLVAAIALLPGASYNFAFERVAGSFGVKFADRLIRFAAASAVFAAVLSAPALLLYRHWVTTGRLRHGEVPAVWFEAVVLGYVVVPTLIGSWLGWASKSGKRWATIIVGEMPEPRAWDRVFRPGVAAIVRARLKSGSWVAGTFDKNSTGRRSYASGYPEEEDLWLASALKIDPATGEFLADAHGNFQYLGDGSGLLLKRADVEYFSIREL